MKNDPLATAARLLREEAVSRVCRADDAEHHGRKTTQHRARAAELRAAADELDGYENRPARAMGALRDAVKMLAETNDAYLDDEDGNIPWGMDHEVAVSNLRHRLRALEAKEAADGE